VNASEQRLTLHWKLIYGSNTLLQSYEPGW